MQNEEQCIIQKDREGDDILATFTYGFYNAVNGDRAYDAVQMAEIFDGMINDGVYATIGDCFIVTEYTEENNTVVIGSGRAWFHHTWNKLDVPMIFAGPGPEINANRIDVIVIEVNSTDRTNAIKWIAGSPSSNPQKPTLINTTNIQQFPICYITRMPGMNIIEQRFIENAVGSTTTPFVTGIIDTIDTGKLLLQWQAQWNNWFGKTDGEWISIKNEYAGQWTNIKQTYESQWAGIKTTYATEWTNIKGTVNNEWSELKSDTKEEQDRIVAELDEWIENDIMGKLEGDVSTALQLQINQVIQDMSNIDLNLIGFDSKTTSFQSNGDIIETYDDGRKIVTHTVNDSQMTQTYSKNNTTIATKTILFNSDGSIRESIALS